MANRPLLESFDDSTITKWRQSTILKISRVQKTNFGSDFENHSDKTKDDK